MPNLTFGPPVVASLRRHSQAYLDCHCMVSNPAQWVGALARAGASQLTFHIEAVEGDEALRSLVESIRAAGMDVGVAIKPGTALAEVLPRLEPLMDQVHLVLVMTVEPGFGGQAFMQEMLPKVEELRARFPRLLIQVDGGLAPDTVALAAQAGANVIVAGSSIFGASDPPRVTIAALREAVTRCIKH